ncbi:predicted protein [Histoplasma capsulatum G186AR]|uniref:Uncharacterized protein n=1 Tax=Ajellomyces capsulatus (strain G186AR / H82 / ATCC MYA-2454 / RMSCC 2432) TaxID=447093 RepID=C0NV66_AJECG|nr:uncharacterized protein HCBG_06830 [Histoplasma capsulatum G186AR]EEH04878.1 predicted protein [Histoplasma capsulatum G186AR]
MNTPPSLSGIRDKGKTRGGEERRGEYGGIYASGRGGTRRDREDQRTTKESAWLMFRTVPRPTAGLQTRTRNWEDACFYTAPDSPSVWPKTSVATRALPLRTRPSPPPLPYQHRRPPALGLGRCSRCCFKRRRSLAPLGQSMVGVPRSEAP